MNPCKTCPFLKDSKNYGSVDWLEDVFHLLQRENTSHTCHSTDPIADGYIGGNKRMCDGIKMLKINQDSNLHLHKKAFRNYKEFFNAQLFAIQTEILKTKKVNE